MISKTQTVWKVVSMSTRRGEEKTLEITLTSGVVIASQLGEQSGELERGRVLSDPSEVTEGRAYLLCTHSREACAHTISQTKYEEIRKLTIPEVVESPISSFWTSQVTTFQLRPWIWVVT
jgi:hypothetical protein